MFRTRSRTAVGLAIVATMLLGALGAPVASAQCTGNGADALNPSCTKGLAPGARCIGADGLGNPACSTSGQVTNTPPAGPAQTSPQPVQGGAQPTSPTSHGSPCDSNPANQPNAPAAPGATISIDPSVAPAGASVTITGQGLGGSRCAAVSLSKMMSTTGLPLGAQQLTTVATAADGTVSAALVIPSVAGWTAGQAAICLIYATAQPVCTPFTLASAGQPVANTATTPDAIVGHYQCSSMLLVGFGSGFCSGTEPILALNGDGTYSYDTEQGTWTFDGSTVSFDGSLGSASVLNRKLTIDTQVQMVDGSTQEVRFTYIRMDY